MEYRTVDINDWIRKGEGSTADSYINKNDSTKMLKLFTGAVTTARYAVKEMKLSQIVEQCGVITPKALEIVICNGRLGIIYESIPNKISYSRLIANNPEKLEYYATLFANELKALHSKPFTSSTPLPPIRDVVIQCIGSNKVFGKKTKAKLIKFVEELGDDNFCIHGDPHTGNLCMSNDKSYWIDLGAFTHGSPWYDLGGVYFFYKIFVGRFISRKILHLKSRQLTNFWKYFVFAYTGKNDKESYKEFTKKAKKSSLLFSLYTMDVEHYTGFVNVVASLVIRDLSFRFKF